ncbi:MAG: Eco57I restriction-modification methylase domain-containing protein [Bacteroidales bacterium]|nr:Eco57I restriction-modification methylase domain-containing protein [Bacteroidales bacterium]
MNTETLRQIFKSPFDYTTYSREIVHRLFGCHDVVSRPEWLDTNAEGDQSFFIGQMDDADHRLLGFFYTRVADGGDVRRKRVGLRKLISPYLKYDVDGAIAVFDDGRHWRLSYICDLKEGSTSAKRFSYILGDENGQYKTPLERLEKVAKLNGHLTLSDLRESFSVDALSDEFFDEYHLHYDRIVANLTQAYRRDVPWRVSTDGTSDTRLHDYVKKMMGRIVFLHFLQKKGWLNDNPTFLRDLFLSSPHQADFLEQVLEPLFFGIFNTEPEQREKLFADEQWDRGLLRQWEHLPYLNGGLFERDEVDKMNIRLPSSLFNDLFTFLASYNFTVDENDPDDAEIGVDPEMLGKIFESLLEDNKAKGAFYTPKEIVRYMCKESLIAYLNEQCTMNNVQLSSAIRSFVENHELPGELEPYREILDRALREVKICDPAIGSGAFPMGLLNELWRCREAISLSPVVETQNFASPSMGPSSSTQSRAALKREIIENNIYGVDIERGAIDIARLRFWLSIVVDSEEPQALPNFDYKFMQGNSLIESFEGVDLSRMMSSEGQHSSLGKGRQKAGANQLGIEFVSTDTKRNLQLMLREYFSLTDHVKKAEARREINDSVKSYIRHQDLRPAAEARLSSLDPSANQEFFLWHTWFKDIFDRGGFDIVVGNPPYVVVGADGTYSSYKTASCLDLYAFFYERAVNILNKNGILSFITSSLFVKGLKFHTLRKFLQENVSVVAFRIEGDDVFKNAEIPTATFIAKKCKSSWRFEDFYADGNIIEHVISGTVPLSSISSIMRGFEIGRNMVGCNGQHKILTGSDVSKYHYTKLSYISQSVLEAFSKDNKYFSKERILLRETGSFLTAVYLGNETIYSNRSLYSILITDGRLSTKYVLALLNSSLLQWYYSTMFKGETELFPKIRIAQAKKLPIPIASKDKQQPIISLVDQILAVKRTNSSADTSALEREIDRLVYGLYGLKEEEVKVVEGK